MTWASGAVPRGTAPAGYPQPMTSDPDPNRPQTAGRGLAAQAPKSGKPAWKEPALVLAATTAAALLFGVLVPSYRAGGFEVSTGPIITVAIAATIFWGVYGRGGVRAHRESKEAALQEVRAQRSPDAGHNAPPRHP